MNGDSLYPNSTETMAERAWRYGEGAFPYRPSNGVTWFGDGSSMTKWGVDTARGQRHILAQVCARIGTDLNTRHLASIDWSPA